MTATKKDGVIGFDQPQTTDYRGVYSNDTEELIDLVNDAPERFLDDWIQKKEPDISFAGLFDHFVRRADMRPKDLMQKCMISKTYYYQMADGERLPGRNTVLRLAFSLGLNRKETDRMLKASRKSPLYPKVRRDAALLYCIQKRMTLDEVDTFLNEIGEEPLFANEK